MSAPMVASELPLPLVRRGKVREVYAVDDRRLLIVASDRVSAFDVVMREAVPDKGRVLTQLSAFWFERLGTVVRSHFLTADADAIVAQVPAIEAHRDEIDGRAMLVRRTEPVAFECVVRGYIADPPGRVRSPDTLAGETFRRDWSNRPRWRRQFSPRYQAETGTTRMALCADGCRARARPAARCANTP